MTHPPEPEPSAVVILHHDDDVYLVQRPSTASFFPGFHAFPGGGTEPEDQQATDLETLRACAARELAEEVRIHVDPSELSPAGVVVTPPFSPIRYRTQFFLHEPGPGTHPDPQQPELAGGEWIDAEAALNAWENGEIKLPPPVIHTLELIAKDGPEAVIARGTSEDRFPITFLPGLRVEPLKVRTLPPHTHTNAFLVGDEALALIDPGAGSPELDRLEATLDALDSTGDPLQHVLLTHHHEDHIAGAAELIDRFDAQLACSAPTAERISLTPDRVLQDGDTITLPDHTIEALETPGHAPGHLAFHLPNARTILAGDLVAGIGTVLIPPGEGDMAAYMESLDRVATYADKHETRLLFPAHGPPLFDPVGKLRDTLAHRQDREQRVLNAVKEGARSLDAIVAKAYEDKPDAPDPLKELSTQAHLAKLVDEDRIDAAERQPNEWHPVRA